MKDDDGNLKADFGAMKRKHRKNDQQNDEVLKVKRDQMNQDAKNLQ